MRERLEGQLFVFLKGPPAPLPSDSTMHFQKILKIYCSVSLYAQQRSNMKPVDTSLSREQETAW